MTLRPAAPRASAKPVVAVEMGSLVNADIFDDLFPGFSEAFTLVVLEAPGASTLSPLLTPAELARHATPAEAMAARLHEKLEPHLARGGAIHHVGHSMGCKVLMAYAAHHPGCVASATALAPVDGNCLTETYVAWKASTMLTAPFSLVPYKEHEFRSLLGRYGASLPDDVLARILSNWKEGQRDPRAVTQQVAVAQGVLPPGLLGRISTPVRIVAGIEDRHFAPRIDLEHIAARMPKATVEQVEGGHFFLTENPAVADQLIADIYAADRELELA